MNYEEMLKAQESSAAQGEQTPLGSLFRKQDDRKFRCMLELRADLSDSLVFCESLRRDQKLTIGINDPHQMHYELHEDSGGIYELELEMGSYQTLSQLLNANPAVVAQKGFKFQTVDALMTFVEQLHGQGVYHLCFAPSTVFMRKSDNAPMLMCHGSSFLKMKDASLLYKGFESYVAPEVLAGGEIDQRSDIYALGRFVEYLLGSTDMPMEYKKIVKKATAEDPSARYSTVSEMREALSRHHGTKRAVLTLLTVLVIVGLLVWAYFDLVPEADTIEFVDNNGLVTKPDPFSVEYEYEEDNSGLDNDFNDPTVAYFLDSLDMAELDDEDDEMPLDSAQASQRAEAVFIKRFTRQAQTMLSNLYSTEQIGGSEAQFVTKSHDVIEELIDYAKELGEQAGLPADVASAQALRIISRLQAQLMEKVDAEEE